MLLTPADLVILTGYERPSAQRGELDRLGIRYLVNSRGGVVVLWSSVESIIGPRKAEDQPTEQPAYGAVA
jgi:hypothetical protein